MSGEVANGVTTDGTGGGAGVTTTAGGGDGTTYRDARGRELCQTFWPVRSLALSAGVDRMLAAGLGLATIDLARRNMRDITNTETPAHACALSADGTRAITASRPSDISLWAGIGPLMNVCLHSRRLFAFDNASCWISSTGDRAVAVLATESESEFFDFRWGVTSSTPAPPRRRKIAGCVSSLSVSEPQGYAAIVIKRNGVHRVIVQRLDELGTEISLRSVPTRSTGTPAACIARNCPLVVVADDASVRLFGAADITDSVLTWGDRGTFTNHPHEMHCVISDDGDLVVARNGPASLKVWSVRHRICIATLTSPRSCSITAVTIASTSQTVIWAEGQLIYSAQITSSNSPSWLGAEESPSTPQFFGPSSRRVRFRHALVNSAGENRGAEATHNRVAQSNLSPTSPFNPEPNRRTETGNHNRGSQSILSPTSPFDSATRERRDNSLFESSRNNRRQDIRLLRDAHYGRPSATTTDATGTPGSAHGSTRRPRRTAVGPTPRTHTTSTIPPSRSRPSRHSYFLGTPVRVDEEDDLAFPLPNFSPPTPKLIDLDALSQEASAPASNDGTVDKKKVVETAKAIETSVGIIENLLTNAVKPAMDACKDSAERISKLHNAEADRDKNILEELTKLNGFAQKLKECGGSPEDETFCPICQDSVEMGERVLQLPCEHIFHRDCMWPYILREARPRCPVCRASISKIFGLILPTWKYRGDGSDKLICKKGFANTNARKSW